ncbi:CYTH domain-containing protein [Cellulophaga sp. F20128]|uniref:CYTH domain-containing protein n=1 Tax=Cellulophaga sp. F20128 TaxID=2926413 RepID=UPI001FF173B6|nr:CYTH domain-containing protein [Cellulophaga sp. F20128]MCK0157495.1 CYTH domain-containing protein [Cellulophaga sp. F20128]
MVEIERKFLVKTNAYRAKASTQKRIVQGFLNTDPERTVRVRIKGETGYLTVKGISNTSGTSRFEWEKEIAQTEAEQLLKICEQGVIDKVRYNVAVGEHIFEVDEFYGDNEGLIVAEVELQTENEHFKKPDWLGDEVTGVVKYYNSQLSKNPYKDWK